MRRAYQVITDRIVDLLEKGTVPWQRPWGTAEGLPKNLVSGKEYRGINVFLLCSAGYESPYWVSYKQARDRGGTVQRGERGYPCVYWNWFDKKDESSGEIKKIPFLRYYTVFNVQQCKDVAYPAARGHGDTFSPIESCEAIVSGMPVGGGEEPRIVGEERFSLRRVA